MAQWIKKLAAKSDHLCSIQVCDPCQPIQTSWLCSPDKLSQKQGVWHTWSTDVSVKWQARLFLTFPEASTKRMIGAGWGETSSKPFVTGWVGDQFQTTLQTTSKKMANIGLSSQVSDMKGKNSSLEVLWHFTSILFKLADPSAQEFRVKKVKTWAFRDTCILFLKPKGYH